MLDTKADEGCQASIVAFNRHLNLDFSMRHQQRFTNLGCDVQVLRRQIKVTLRCFRKLAWISDANGKPASPARVSSF